MIMNYEKAYKDALERAKKVHKYSSDIAEIKRMEDIFPELKESEDERIKEALIKFHKSTIDIDGIKGEVIIEWLEKQGEQELDGFDAELNALLKKYEYLPNDEMVECLKFYTAELINNKQRMEQ